MVVEEKKSLNIECFVDFADFMNKPGIYECVRIAKKKSIVKLAVNGIVKTANEVVKKKYDLNEREEEQKNIS